MKKYVFYFLISLLSVFLFAQTDSAEKANHRTAVRCLTNAQSLFAQENYDAAVSQVSLALAYDDSISDLWYILAACNFCLGKNRSEVAPFLKKALEMNVWANPNRDSARIMYADILSDMGNYRESIALLDEVPKLYSSDSEFIRAKSYYRLGDEESVSIARNKIDGARRIYPSDSRFPLLFFKNESPNSDNSDVERIASYFVSRILMSNTESHDAELEIYAAIFAKGADREHLLKSFNARGLRHPIYAVAALSDNMISEEKALSYFASFADNEIDFDIFCTFFSIFQDKTAGEQALNYLATYSGTIVQDSLGDGINDFFVKYSRGRPQTVYLDADHDGIVEWSIKCDFGVPVSAFYGKTDMEFRWDRFPYLSTVKYKSDENKKYGIQQFNLVNDSLEWTPVSVKKLEFVMDKYGIDFFYPEFDLDTLDISGEIFLVNSSSFEISSEQERGKKIHFMILDGKPKMALYYENDKLYAQTQFENNLPYLRVVDEDRDGVFETTEFFSEDRENKFNVHTLEDERQIMENLFGYPSDGSSFYLKMIQLDTNGDNVCDYTEEYLEQGGRISSWDTDGDNMWNVRHVIYPNDGVSIEEESMFYVNSGKKLVVVKSENGIPKSVTKDDEVLFVYRDPVYDYYWLTPSEPDFSKERYTVLAKKALETLSSKAVQGESVIVSIEDCSVLSVRIGKNNFGIIVENVDSRD